MLKIIKKHKKFLFIYTLIFLILFLLNIQFWFIKYNKSFIWKYDGLEQQFTGFIYVGKWIRTVFSNIFIHHQFTIPLWDLSIGYGSDVMSTLCDYFYDPFNYLSAFISPLYAEYLFDFLIVLRLYLTGLSFYAFCFYKKHSYKASLLGSVLYVFAPAVMIVFKQPNFINLFIYFPLIMLGCEKLWYEKKGTLLFISFLLTTIYNFYFSYMISIMIVVYAVIKFIFIEKEKTGKRFIELFRQFSYHCGLSVSAGLVLYLPVIMNLMNTSRLSYQRKLFFFFRFDKIQTYFTYYFLSYDTGTDAILGFSILTLVSIMVLMLRKGYKDLKLYYILLTVSLFSAQISSLFNGFNYPAYRWNFAYQFLISYIMVVTFNKLFELSKKEILIIISFFTGYLILFSQTKNYQFNVFLYHYRVVFSILFILCISLFFIVTLIKKIPKTLKENLIIMLFSLSTVINSTVCFSARMSSLVTKEVNRGKAFSLLTESKKILHEIKDKKDYRYDEIGTNRYRNAGMIESLNSYDFYYSYYNENIDHFHKSIGLTNSSFSFTYAGLGYLSYLHLLNGTKYIITPSDYKKMNPYPYNRLIRKEKNYHLYQSSIDTSIAHFFTHNINEQDYDLFNEFERYQILTRAIVSKEKSDYQKTQKNYEQMNYQTLFNNSSSYKDSIYKANWDNASVDFKFKEIRNRTLYLQIKDLDVISEWIQSYRIKIEGYYRGKKIDNINEYIDSRTIRSNLYGHKHNWLMSLGMMTGIDTIRIIFPYRAQYKISSLNLYTKSKEQTNKDISHLDCTNIDFHYDTNRLSIHTNKDQDGYLYMAVPYDKNWQAFIDGKKTDILKANKAFMAVKLPKGRHTILFKYHQKELYIAFFGSIGIVCLYVILNRMTGKRN